MNFVKIDVKSVDSKFSGTVYVNTEHIVMINEKKNLISLDNGNILVVRDEDFKKLFDACVAPPKRKYGLLKKD